MDVWRSALAPDADLLVYGCNVAGGQWGFEFIQDLADITGADVAASVDLTGASALGGDWMLESSTGTIEAHTVINTAGGQHFAGLLLVTVPAEDFNAPANFDISEASVVVTDQESGNELDNRAFNELNDSILLNGSGQNNVYRFAETPELGPNQLMGSRLDGGSNDNGKVDFSGFGNNNTDLKFTIKGITDPNDNDGISVFSDGLVFPHIYRVKELVGGKQESTFEFHNEWNANLKVGATANNGQVILDFTNLNQNLSAIILANGTVQATRTNNNQIVATATKVSQVNIAQTHSIDLDLRGINAELTIRLDFVDNANARVTISTADSEPMIFNRVGSMVLGGGKNSLVFGPGAIIPAITPGGANTTVELDYSNFGQSASVNLGDAAVELTSQPQRVANNAPRWGTTTYQLTDLTGNGINTRFFFGGNETQQVHAAANIGQSIQNRLNSAELPGVLNAVVTNGDVNNSHNIEIKSSLTASEDSLLRLDAAGSLATWTDTSDTIKQLAVDASHGSFIIKTTVNGAPSDTDPIDIADARNDASEIAKALNNLISPGGINAAVTGRGTVAQPWEITWDNDHNGNGLTVVAMGVDVSDLQGTRRLTLTNTNRSVPTVLSQWTLAFNNNTTAGMFTLKHKYGMDEGQDYTTAPLPFDAPSSLIEEALKRASTQADTVNAIVEVTPGDNGWNIGILDKRTQEQDDLDAVSLSLENVGARIDARSAAGIGNLTGSANGLGIGDDAISVTKITGNAHGDRLFTAGADQVGIVTGNQRNVAAGTAGSDTIQGGTREDTLSGEASNDTLLAGGNQRTDILVGGAGSDVLLGDDGNDLLFGGNDNDNRMIQVGPIGNTREVTGILGEDGDDFLDGGDGIDVLDGGQGHDTLVGGDGMDMLQGGPGVDSLSGGTDTDELRGGDGDDQLDGGNDSDNLRGNQGNDTYVFANGWGTFEQVIELANEGDDTIDLSSVSADLTVTIKQAAAVNDPAAFQISDGNNTIGGQGHAIANEVDVTYVERIRAGTGTNTYVVDQNWLGDILIDDTDSGRYGTLDLQAIDEDLSVIIQPVTVHRDGRDVIVDGVVVTREDVMDPSTITLAGIANIRVGQQQTTITVQSGTSLPGTLLPPANAVNHSVVLNYGGRGNVQSVDGAIVNFGEAINLNSTANGGTSHLHTTAGLQAAMSQWNLVVSSPSQGFSLTFGDRQTGTHTTKAIDLAQVPANDPNRDATLQNLVQTALSALPNVQQVNVVAGNGTAAAPFQVQIYSKIGTNPVLSSAKYAVSQLTMPELINNPVAPNTNRQELSFFANDANSGSFNFRLSFTDPVNGGPLTTNVSADIDYRAARADRNELRTAINNLLQNAQDINGHVLNPVPTVQSLTGSGTHHDPWIVSFDNSPIANSPNFSIAEVDATGIKSFGSLHLKETIKGDKGEPSEATLYLAACER